MVSNDKLEKLVKISGPDTFSQQVKALFPDANPSINLPIQNVKTLEEVKRKKLYAENFKPDNIPTQIPAPLEDPSFFYKAKNPKRRFKNTRNFLKR